MSSERRTGERAVAPVVGFVLLLGILVTALAVYQVTFVPAQNAEVEFDHSRQVASDLEQLRAATLDLATTDATDARNGASVQINLGVKYPTRLVALNPPPARGTLRTDRGSLRIDNAVATEQFRGTPNETLLGVDHETRLFRFEPDYAEETTPPRFNLEHSLLYNQESGANVTIADQQLVRNESKRIDLVLFEGDIDESGLSTTVDLITLDGPTGTVPLQAETGDTFDVVIPTYAPDVWTSTQAIGATFEEGEPNVRAEKTGPEEVTLTVDDTANEDWTLQVTRLGIGDGPVDDELSGIGPYERPLGPAVTLEMPDEVTVTAGEQVDLVGNTTSVGGETERTGTPIQAVRADIEGEPDQTPFEGSPDETNRTIDLGGVNASIDTAGWSQGTHNVTVRAQDAAGLTSNRDTGQLVINVTG